MQMRRSYYFLAVAGLPLFFALQNPKINEPFHEVFLTVFKPLLLAGHGMAYTISETRDHAVHFWNTFQDQGKYEKKMQELSGQLLHYQELAHENARLKKLLEFKDSIPEKTISSRVIGWDISLLRKTVILDKGTSQGITKNSALIVSDGLVGRVLDAGSTTARAILLVDPEARVGALTGDTRAHGLVAGDGSSRMSMQYLDLDSGVAVGETVLTSGVSGLFPKGIGIGRIESISKDPNGLHLTARVIPFVQFSKLEEVLCLKSFRQE